jgi:predicted NAD-dependent protein-ADP-ribosyltransferase YbiA (DUF1768 family)
MDKFYFYSKSRDAKPGKGANECVTKEYEDLEKIKDWRKVLSNFHVSPFVWRGSTWNSIEHAFQATKIALVDPEKAKRFTRESGDEIGLGDGAMAQKHRKMCLLNKDQVREWGRKNMQVMEEIARAKYSQCEEARQVLKATKDAELWHIVSRKPAVRFEHLERIRKEMT